MWEKSLATIADWKRLRFSTTFLRSSQSVNARLSTFSFPSELAPPNLVLKPWMSQENLLNGLSCSTFRPLLRRSVQGEEMVAGFDGSSSCRCLWVGRFGSDGFAEVTI